MDRLSRELRAAIGERTQDEIGALLGLDQATISRLLCGQHRPGPKATAALLRQWPHLGGAVLECFAGGGTDSGPPGDGSGRRQQRTRSAPVREPQEGEAAG